MIHMSIRMTIPSDKRIEAQGILVSVAERTRIEPGCISCHVYQGVGNKHVVLIDE